MIWFVSSFCIWIVKLLISEFFHQICSCFGVNLFYWCFFVFGPWTGSFSCLEVLCGTRKNPPFSFHHLRLCCVLLERWPQILSGSRQNQTVYIIYLLVRVFWCLTMLLSLKWGCRSADVTRWWKPELLHKESWKYKLIRCETWKRTNKKIRRVLNNKNVFWLKKNVSSVKTQTWKIRTSVWIFRTFFETFLGQIKSVFLLTFRSV